MNQPATPLPWRTDSHPESDFAEIVGPMDGIAAQASHEDAAYIVQACNAYPRLVEALRDASAQPLNWHPDHASALLRELGESE